MSFNELALWLEQLERESSRLKITEMLSDLFKQVTAHEAQMVAYFCMGTLYPPYKAFQFNIARKSAEKVVGRIFDLSASDVKKHLATVSDVAELLKDGNWKSQVALSIKDVYKRLQDLAEISGEGSQEAKIDKLAALLQEVHPLAAKYLLRIVLGILRLGFSDMTIIDALSWMLVENKSLSKKIEDAYNRCADIGHVTFIAKKDGIDGITHMRVIVGVPIRPAAAERMPSAGAIISKLGICVAEPKLDGFRLQIHINKRHKKAEINFFSRNLVDMSDMYPDLVKALEKIDAETVIFEGEAIAFDPNTGSFMPFQETVKRKRKHGIETAAEEMPLQLFLFDILYLDNHELFHEPLSVRRSKLVDLINRSPVDKKIVQVTEELKVATAKELEDYFLLQINNGLEGVVVKRPDAPYQPGKRNFNWIKLKRLEEGHLLDTIDGVILGYYYGRGKRATFGIGAILVGLYNKSCDCFQTVAKIGTGFSDQEWRTLKKRCDALGIEKQQKNVECNKDLRPDVWVRPEIVVEMTADEITKSPVHTASGFALRFPRFMRYRDDKNEYETTSVQELEALFKQQKQRK